VPLARERGRRSRAEKKKKKRRAKGYVLAGPAGRRAGPRGIEREERNGRLAVARSSMFSFSLFISFLVSKLL
jgi:hypothetical protein